MPNVKIIDASTWAALPEIPLEEGESFATKGLASGQYRPVHTGFTGVTFTQWTGTGVESAGEVGAANMVAQLVATGVESASEVGATTVAESGGATAFTLTELGHAYNSPASDTIVATAAGNLMLAVISNRNGVAHANHTLSDANSGVWTKLFGHDQEISDPNARHAVSVWWREATTTDASGSFVVTAGDGASGSKGLLVAELIADGAYTWTFEEHAVADSGTSDWNGTDSGSTASIATSDNLVIGFASARNGTPAASVSFSGIADAQIDRLRNTNEIGQAIAIKTGGQAGGTKSTTLTATGSVGSEGIVGVIVFSG